MDRVAYDQAYYAKNKATIRARQVEYETANKARRRDFRYGLQPGEFDEMFAHQNGECAICLSPFGDDTPCIDHDHTCCPGLKSCGKCVRGILCRQCNAWLGRVKDDPIVLRRAANYLEGSS